MKISRLFVLFFALVWIDFANAQIIGIDVSKYQGTINWPKVASDKSIKFVYIKATEGTTIQDPLYKTNVKNAKKAGILVGSYHLYSGKTTAYQQFDNFKSVVNKSEQDLIPVLDIEEIQGRNLYKKRVDKLLELMEIEYGVKPIIYTCEKVYWEHFSGKEYEQYQIFIANYNRYPSTRFTIWQHSQTGRVPGIKGPVDLDKIHENKCLNDIKLPSKSN